MPGINLKICDDAEGVAREAGGVLADLIRSNPAVVLGLPTGSTPELTYAELVRLHREDGLSFSGVTTFNMDEYWGLEGDHPQSYRAFMNRTLFDKVDIKPWNTHVLNGRAANPHLECQAYETKILSVGGIQLWLMGIGVNGHIAFNEPGSLVDSRTRLINLSPSTIEANSDGRFFKDQDEVPRCALSVGIGSIREAPKLLLLATGPGKARAIADAVEGPFSPECPASLLQDHPDCTFVLDRSAAGELKQLD